MDEWSQLLNYFKNFKPLKIQPIMKKNLTTIFALVLLTIGLSPTIGHAQCTDWVAPTDSTGWIDFNNIFGGAPCDDGTGCPFNEISAFEVFAAEAYSVDNFIAGGEYAFSMCNGPGNHTWVPEFTIISPTGIVDAFGAGDGDSCTITWTASESGTYLIVINEEGECGGGMNTGTANGFPALTCIANAPCEPVICNAGILNTTGESFVCGLAGTFDLETINDTVPSGGGLGYVYSDILGGTGGVVGGFTITGSSPDLQSLNSDLNGILSTNSLPVLSGTWVVRGIVYTNVNDIANTTCSEQTDSLIVTFGNDVIIDNIEDSGDGSASVTVSGGTAPFTYLWSDPDGQTTATAVNLDPGSYSVTITDAIGCTATSTVDVISSAIENIESLESLLISPNPSSGQFSVRFELNETKAVNIEVFDVTGKRVDRKYSLTSGGKIDFDLEGQPKGMYFIKIIIDNESLSRRLVLTK